MSLIFSDGFDHYAGTNNPQIKGWINAGMGNNGAGRIAGSAIVGAAGGGSRYVYRVFDASQEHQTFIVHFAMVWSGVFNAYPGEILRIASDTAGTNHINLIINGPTGTLSIRRGGTVIAGPTPVNAFPGNQWHQFALKATLDDVNGMVELRKNGSTAPLLSVSGIDTRNAGTKAVFDSIYLGRITQDGGTIQIDDVCVCNGAGTVNNDFLGDVKVRAYYPNGNGTYSEFTGSDSNQVDNYQLIDEPTTPSTADYVASSIDGQRDTYTFPDVATTEQIAGVQLVSYAAKSDAGGSRSVRMLSRVNGTDYAGTDRTLGTSYNYEIENLEVNPDTGLPWTLSEFNSSEFGIEGRP